MKLLLIVINSKFMMVTQLDQCQILAKHAHLSDLTKLCILYNWIYLMLFYCILSLTDLKLIQYTKLYITFGYISFMFVLSLQWMILLDVCWNILLEIMFILIILFSIDPLTKGCRCNKGQNIHEWLEPPEDFKKGK